MKIEIAAGTSPQKIGADWLLHDKYPFPGIDIICDWRRIPDYMGFLKLVDFEEVYSRHFIEHLDPEEGLDFLRLCHHILGKDGGLTVLCPNMKWLCKKYLRGDYADVSEFICWMYGGGDGHDWSFHKAAYDCDLLCRAMKTVGFEITSYNNQGFLLEVNGVKA
jgi:predicted SAM-dependent methyltransferase